VRVCACDVRVGKLTVIARSNRRIEQRHIRDVAHKAPHRDFAVGYAGSVLSVARKHGRGAFEFDRVVAPVALGYHLEVHRDYVVLVSRAT